ncbi:MAG: hypothetical protein ABJO67_02330 [Pseudoruegeria sp.]
MKTITRSIAAIALLLGSVAHSETPQTGDTLTNVPPIDYYIFNQSVNSFFDDLERDTSLRLQVSPQVTGSLRDVSLSGPPLDVVRQVSGSLGLDWYTFNDVIHVSAKSESGTRVVRLGDLTPEYAMTALRRSGLPIDRFPAQITGQGSALAFSGPPTLLALAEAVMETIPEVSHPTPALITPQPGKSIVVRRGVDVQLVPIQ